MSSALEKKTVITFRQEAITACLITVFLSFPAQSATPELNQANADLQKIYQRIKSKYAAHEAQQAKLATQSQVARIGQVSSAASQPFDENLPTTARSFPASDLYPTHNDGNQSRFIAGEELILSTSLNNLELASIFGLKTETGLQIGIGDFFQIIEVPIYTDLENVSADGWLKKEDNPFTLKRLNDQRLQVKVNNKTYYISPDDYKVDNDIFIELEELKRWLGFDYALNEEALALAIKTKDKFPVELRLARLNRPAVDRAGIAQSTMPLKESPYKAFTVPLLDVQVAAQTQEWVLPSTSNTPDSPKRVNRYDSQNYSILANQDLAYLNAELFLAGSDQDSLNSARLTFSRESDKGDLLGPLGATEYSFGDVVPVNAGFGNTLGLSRGVSVNNTPLNQLADNRKVNITGPIQEGWDVELYRNGILIDQNLSITEGRYEFNDIALDYGNNDFELIMYGPQGQIESKTESYIVDSNNVTAGQGMYRLSLVEVGKSVFDVYNYDDDPSQQGFMISSVFDYGVTDWLALNVGTSTFEPEEGDIQNFLTAGANLSLGKAGLFSARYLQSDDDLKSLDVNYRTRFWDTSYALTARRSEQFEEYTGNTRDTEFLMASMSGRLFSNSRLPVSYQNNWQLTHYDNDTKDEVFQNAIGIGTKLGYLSNSLIWQKNDPASFVIDPTIPYSSEQVSGAVQYRKNFGRLNFRLFGNYDVKPVEEVSAYGTALNYNWSPQLNSELRYSHFASTDSYQVNLGMNWRKDAFYVSTTAGYNEDGSWSAGIGLRFSLGYEPLGQSIFTSGRPMSQSGAVSARVFEDLNMNGIFDVNERPIENATVKAVQAYRQEKTNESGIAVLSSLYHNAKTDIIVDESTLDGPFMISATPGVAIKARKGYVDTVELPVVRAGELDGIVYQHGEEGEPEVAPYIMLNLIDAKQNIVATTRSEFDGYYQFINVKPGHYQLKVDEGYTDRRNLKPGQHQLGFSNKGDVITGVDFVLRPLDEAKGYVAVAGQFTNTSMLKLYYHILRQRLGGRFIQQPFYIRQPGTGANLLGLAYFPSAQGLNTTAEKQAKDACAPLLPHKLNCEVQYLDFKY